MNEDYYKNLSLPSPAQSNDSYDFGLFVGALFIIVFTPLVLSVLGFDLDAFLHLFNASFNLPEPSIIVIFSIITILLLIFYSKYAKKWNKQHDAEHEQRVYESWIDERLELYMQLKSKKSELQLSQIPYIDEMVKQYKNNRRGTKILGLLFFLFFSSIFFPGLVFIPLFSIIDIVLGMLSLFIISFGISYWAEFFHPVMDKFFSVKDPDRHMIRALKTGNLNLLIIEVKRIEDSQVNTRISERGTSTSYLFWFSKAELLILNGDIFYANQILSNLRKQRILKNLLLQAEIDLLLALNYINTDKEAQALELLQEAKIIFTKNKITDPLSIINDKILYCRSKTPY